MKLNEKQQSVLNECEDEFCHSYAGLESRTGILLPELKPIVQELKKMGLIVHVRGLMDEDGKVAGSGFMVTPEGEALQTERHEW